MRARVITALALIPPVLAALFCTSPWPIFGLLLALTLIGASEIHRMTGQVLSLFGLPFVLGISAAIGSPWMNPHSAYSAWAIVGLVAFLAAVASLFIVPARSRKSHPLSLLFGGWLVGPFLSLYALHQAPEVRDAWFFASPLLLAVLPLWAGDTAAIFAGKAFGKHKLAPTISPKKTVEGAIANLIACILAAWGIGSLIQVPVLPSLACGFAAGIFGQAGDLFESWMKRRVDLKDSGTILPGHGGVLDRIDSILFTAPAVALILLFWPWQR